MATTREIKFLVSASAHLLSSVGRAQAYLKTHAAVTPSRATVTPGRAIISSTGTLVRSKPRYGIEKQHHARQALRNIPLVGQCSLALFIWPRISTPEISFV